ncbi:MAG: hypothetical protein COA78_09030 [Blastopirellula sp.]|nr:MAG: hypothetical protein COA78_09030 [Blastopirellula sp.]
MVSGFAERQSTYSISKKRYFAGVSIGRDARQVGGVLLSISGEGLDAEIELITQGHVKLPRPLREDIIELISGSSSSHNLSSTAAQVSELQAVVVENMLHECGIEATQVTGTGVWGPEIWSLDDDSETSVVTLGSPSLLAESTGITVVDAFSEREVAAGGSGGPIEALPLWLLFQEAFMSNTAKPVLLLSVDQAIDAFFIPHRRVSGGLPKVHWVPVSPGYALKDSCLELAKQGNQTQHRSTAALVDQWHAVPELYDLPLWKPTGLSPELFISGPEDLPDLNSIDETIRQFWVKQIIHAWKQQLPQTPKVSEVIVFGPGANDPTLIDELQLEFDDIPVQSIMEARGWSVSTPLAAVAAMLAFLHVEKIPANLPLLTGAKSARVLGRVSPGSPANWQAFLRQLTEKQNSKLPLRDAI